MKKQLPPIIENELERCGRPWSTRFRKRHLQILIEGQPVAVISYGSKSARTPFVRASLNTRAAIRRYLRGQP